MEGARCLSFTVWVYHIVIAVYFHIWLGGIPDESTTGDQFSRADLLGFYEVYPHLKIFILVFRIQMYLHVLHIPCACAPWERRA